jgi:hypothetical protein
MSITKYIYVQHGCYFIVSFDFKELINFSGRRIGIHYLLFQKKHKITNDGQADPPDVKSYFEGVEITQDHIFSLDNLKLKLFKPGNVLVFRENKFCQRRHIITELRDDKIF